MLAAVWALAWRRAHASRRGRRKEKGGAHHRLKGMQRLDVEKTVATGDKTGDVDVLGGGAVEMLGVESGHGEVAGSGAAPFPRFPGLEDEQNDGEKQLKFRPWLGRQKVQKLAKFQRRNVGN